MRKLEVSLAYLAASWANGDETDLVGVSKASLRWIMLCRPQGNRSALWGGPTPPPGVLQIQWHMSDLKDRFIFLNTLFFWPDQCKHKETMLKPIFTTNFAPLCNGVGTQALQQHQSWWQRYFRHCRQMCRGGSVDNAPFGQQSQRQMQLKMQSLLRSAAYISHVQSINSVLT